MCLSYITDKNEYPEAEGVGYKILKKQGDILSSIVFNDIEYQCNIWEIAKCKFVYARNMQKYKAGFHIFEKEKDAQTYLSYIPRNKICMRVIVKVRYRYILAQGIETWDSGDPQVLDPYLKVIVAEQMMIER